MGRVKNRVLQIENPECVKKTFPYFFEEFSRVCSEAVPVITVDGPTASGKGTIANHVGKIWDLMFSTAVLSTDL